MTTTPPQATPDTDTPLFNITFKLRRSNGGLSLRDDQAFVYPPEYGPGIGIAEQQWHGWLAFHLPIAAATRLAAAKAANRLARAVYTRWSIGMASTTKTWRWPQLPPEEEMTEIQLDPGIGNETYEWGTIRLVSCNVCDIAVVKADTFEEGRVWMLAHPNEHTDEQRDHIGEGIQHYKVRSPDMADLKDMGLYYKKDLAAKGLWNQ